MDMQIISACCTHCLTLCYAHKCTGHSNHTTSTHHTLPHPSPTTSSLLSPFQTYAFTCCLCLTGHSTHTTSTHHTLPYPSPYPTDTHDYYILTHSYNISSFYRPQHPHSQHPHSTLHLPNNPNHHHTYFFLF